MSKARDIATRTGLVEVIPTSVTVGSGSGSVAANGKITFTGATSIAVDGAFTTTYDNYRVLFYVSSQTGTYQPLMRYRAGGSTLSGASTYRYMTVRSYGTTVDTYPNSAGYDSVVAPANIGTGQAAHWIFEFYNPKSATDISQMTAQWFAYDSSNFVQATTQSTYYPPTSKDGLYIASTGSMTGTMRVYGYNNG